ncbi:MAG: putative LysR family transcriptional regulator [Herbinix sp.]|jgi:DNA-binding transcriptional LysR family regulator|nr:putative LysR family transcriptional regulator [Herbinix sp.]
MESVYEYIYAVKSLGSFTKAADHLHISQPALSIAIKKLEQELNYAIFDRNTNPTTLTPAGEIILSHIEKIMLLESNTKAALNDLDSMTSGRLMIGGTQYITAFILPDIIFRFKEKYPQIDIEFIESSSANLADLLINNKIDLMFSVKSFDASKFTFFKSFTDYLYVAIPKKLIGESLIKEYILTRQDVISNLHEALRSIPSLEDLKSIPFLLLREGNNLYDRSKMLFEVEGISPPITMSLDQLTTAHYLCKSGMGATFTTGQLIKQIDDHENLVYLKVDHPLMTRNFKIVVNKNRYRSNIMNAFIKEFQ